MLLAAGLAVRGPLLGHVCVDLASVADTVVVERADPEVQPELVWPPLPEWLAALPASALVAGPDDVRPGSVVARPLVLDGDRLYLHRYWRYEQASWPTIVDRSDQAADRGDQPATGPTNSPRPAPSAGARPAVRSRRAGPGRSSAPGRRVGADPPAHGDRRRPGNGQDPNGGPAARRPRGARDRRRSTARHPPRCAHGQGRVPHDRGRRGSGREADELPAEVRDRLLATEAVTLHRLLGSDGRGGFRHDCRRSAAGRRRGGRRELDGLPAADGPPVRRGPP